MKVGLFGGSFDPIHRGHLEPVRAARRTLGLERVIYLPTGRPPHKSERAAPAHARYAMVELALLAEEGLYASPFELRDDRPSYTVDTVDHFHRTLPGVELVLLIGGDSWASFTTWRQWRRILELAALAVLVRPDCDLAVGPPAAAADPEAAATLAAQRAAGRLSFVVEAPVAASSTAIRACLGRGEEPPLGALPPLVLDYIRKYGLYREP